MVPPPKSLGLVLCEKVIVEEGTRNLTLVNTFTKRRYENFPSRRESIVVYTALTGSLGSGRIDLVAHRLDTFDEVFSRRMEVDFPDRLAAVRLLFRINNFSFPVATRYQFSLLVDGELVTQSSFPIEPFED
jgi:hypothetical protein